jgi:hypothetical protein
MCGWALLPLVAGIPLAASTVLVLRHFYVLGGFWGDSGQISYVLWHSDLLLHMPRLDGGGSYFGLHFTPIFVPISWLSRIIPLTREQFFALFVGVCNMMPAVAVYWLLVSRYLVRCGWAGLLGAAALGLLFAFNGVALAEARNPHFEMLIVGSGMMFLVALVLRRTLLAAVFFVICLASREDAGFHLFALLVVTLALGHWEKIKLEQREHIIIFAAIALAYSVAALAAQHVFFPGHSSMRSVYLGSPAFATLGWREIGIRVGFFVVYRAYIFLPALMAVGWAIRRRDPFIAAGYIAFIPWGILQLVAASWIAGTMSNYYAFPYIFSLFWPLIGCLIGPADFRPSAHEAVAGFTLMLAASLVGVGFQHNPGHIDLPASFYSLPSPARQQATDGALLRFAASPQAFGTVAIDGSIGALDSVDFGPQQLLDHARTSPTDTVIFFDQGYEIGMVRTLALSAGLNRWYQIPGTSLRVVSNHPLDGVLGLTPASGF